MAPKCSSDGRSCRRSEPAAADADYHPLLGDAALDRVTAFALLEQENRYSEDDPRYRLSMVLPQQEVLNSVAVTKALLGEAEEEEGTEEELQASAISEDLGRVSPDLESR